MPKFFSSLSILLAVLTAGVMLYSCNSEDVITAGAAPRIVLDNPDGVYEVKAGHELTIAPEYVNAEGATYSWKIDGNPAGNTPSLTRRWDDPGEYYVDITVRTSAGTATEELRVDVLEPGIPYISLPFTGNELLIELYTDYMLTPEIANSTEGELRVEWAIDGGEPIVSPTLHFTASELGTFPITVTATNADGSDTRQFSIKVVERLPFELSFPAQSYFMTATTRYTFPGRPVYLRPIMSGLDGNSFVWSVDGVTVSDCDAQTFVFTPNAPAEYTVNVTVDGMATASVKVVCVDATEASRRRAVTSASSAVSNRVFEWVPAPGQFIGETQTGGMTGNETTLEAANAWAQNRLAAESYVSLGGFGGYIIVGFDHSIANNETSYDFAIMANAFFNLTTGAGGSNEPGIVYVSQDVNGNGLPDDEWYELRGSETGNATTISDYAVTYFRPAAPKMNIQWTDNLGATGCIDYLQAFHRQDYYYPAWIPTDAYTLRGTRLQARTTQDPSTGFWDNSAFGWGYADNMGSDCLDSNDAEGGQGQRNGFLIKNAMHIDGTHINLAYIDFIRVQTGVNSKAGWLGEVSTEVFGFQDLTLMK